MEGEYDPDNESVLISSTQFGTFTLPVQRGAVAKQFVSQFDLLNVSQPDFLFSGNTIQLDKLTFSLPSGETFAYDSKSPSKYVKPLSNESVTSNPASGGVVPPASMIPPKQIATKDVDTDIPEINRMSQDVYAVIIGNEHYLYEAETRFSANDANVFKAYCTKTLGIPEKNIFEKTDATYGEMLQSIQFLKNASEANNGNIRLLFYYSGHGMSDIKDNRMYLIPTDGSSMTLQAALRAEQLYKELSDMKPLSATVFLDACFSGYSSGGALTAMLNGKGIEITPKEETLYGNLVVFSATSEAEIAYPFEEKKHSMFTYFLLEKLHENKGDVTYLDLATYVIQHVKLNAFNINKKMQTPKIQTSYDIVDVWETWKLVK
ncbi:hypothetical protein AGMMS49574_14790 [Bacteroidia bacterium]|nr:hypothetical protein AGMMS49574_14790 [Bacteroidia bacterium]